MIYTVPTRYEELTLVIKVYTHSAVNIRIKVVDADQPNTTFTDRDKIVEGESIFFVRMPVSPKTALIYVYNKDLGNMTTGQDKSFELQNTYSVICLVNKLNRLPEDIILKGFNTRPHFFFCSAQSFGSYNMTYDFPQTVN